MSKTKEEEKEELLEKARKYRLLLNYYNNLLSYFLTLLEPGTYDNRKIREKDEYSYSIENYIFNSILNIILASKDTPFSLDTLEKETTSDLFGEKKKQLIKEIENHIEEDMEVKREFHQYTLGEFTDLIMELPDTNLKQELESLEQEFRRHRDLLIGRNDIIYEAFTERNLSEILLYDYTKVAPLTLIKYLNQKKEAEVLTQEQYSKFVMEFIDQLLYPKIKTRGAFNRWICEYILDFAQPEINEAFKTMLLNSQMNKTTEESMSIYTVLSYISRFLRFRNKYETIDGEKQSESLRYLILDTIVEKIQQDDSLNENDYFKIIVKIFSNTNIIPEDNEKYALHLLNQAEGKITYQPQPIIILLAMNNIKIGDELKKWTINTISKFEQDKSKKTEENVTPEDEIELTEETVKPKDEIELTKSIKPTKEDIIDILLCIRMDRYTDNIKNFIDQINEIGIEKTPNEDTTGDGQATAGKAPYKKTPITPNNPKTPNN